MEGWTAQRVLALAPDPASAKAGQGLANARKWDSFGHDQRAVWGECQGSGAKPYRVQVDLSEPAFKCSCPSRKFPCKHGIGLMLLLASSAVAAGQQPAWVEQWLASRTEKAEKKQAKADEPPKPVDEAAQAKRREKRLERVGEGLAALKLWVEDFIRGGVATAPTRGYAFFDEQAKRMVDAQAPGIAARIASLAAIASSGADWHGRFLESLATLHLIASSFERLADLPAERRDELLEVVGIPRPQEEVIALQPVNDRWQVISQEVSLEDRLRVQRTWLYGAAERRPALVLSFSHVTQPMDVSLPPGFSFDGELCFYPGSVTRAAIKLKQDPKPLTAFEAVASLDALCDMASELRAKQPWLEGVTIPVRSVTPVRRDAGWSLVDADRQSLPAMMTDTVGWRLLALSGGHPIDLALAYDFAQVRPIAVATEGEYRSLAINVAES